MRNLCFVEPAPELYFLVEVICLTYRNLVYQFLLDIIHVVDVARHKAICRNIFNQVSDTFWQHMWLKNV